MPMGMADVATVLFEKHLKFDAKAPDWPDRDRFILSAGHGSMLLYSLLHLTGYEDMTLEQVKNFRQWGAITAGHPGIWPRQRDRDHHRPAGSGHLQRGRLRHGRRNPARALARRSSITILMSSRATAA